MGISPNIFNSQNNPTGGMGHYPQLVTEYLFFMGFSFGNTGGKWFVQTVDFIGISPLLINDFPTQINVLAVIGQALF